MNYQWPNIMVIIARERLRQLLLMCNIADKYKEKIPAKDWKLFVKVAVDKKKYMTDIIDNDTGPLRKKDAQKAYNMFVKTVCEN